jgi:hypothetical protein
MGDNAESMNLKIADRDVSQPSKHSDTDSVYSLYWRYDYPLAGVNQAFI